MTLVLNPPSPETYLNVTMQYTHCQIDIMLTVLTLVSQYDYSYKSCAHSSCKLKTSWAQTPPPLSHYDIEREHNLFVNAPLQNLVSYDFYNAMHYSAGNPIDSMATGKVSTQYSCCYIFTHEHFWEA